MQIKRDPDEGLIKTEDINHEPTEEIVWRVDTLSDGVGGLGLTRATVLDGLHQVDLVLRVLL